MKIATHNAKFHSDDVFAVATLLMVYPDSEIVRTRDKQVIESADIVVDVGEVYDPTIRRFDHHQATGGGERGNGVPYASFGLVWKEYGEQICGSRELAERIDRLIVQPIDGPDNGEHVVLPRFSGIFQLDINTIVDSFRATWKEEDNWDERFMECVKWAKSFLERTIKIERDSLEGEDVVRRKYEESSEKEIIIFDESQNVGREMINTVLSQYPEPIYAVLYRKDALSWQVVAIRKNGDTFEARKRLPEAWGSKHEEEISQMTGVDGVEFCHRKGFMCVAKTKEGAITLARKALES